MLLIVILVVIIIKFTSYLLGPTPPIDLKATNKGSAVEISWKKPIHPISKFIQHFKIIALESKTKIEALVSGNEYVYVLSNCKPMTHYSFQLSTLTSNDLESQTSEKVEIQIEGRNTININNYRFDYFEVNKCVCKRVVVKKRICN